MALGGGVFVTQDKVLPGAYINFVSSGATPSVLGERGVVAIALPLGKAAGSVITLTKDTFKQNSLTLLGKSYDSTDVVSLREIFKHSSKIYVYDLGNDVSAKTVTNALDALEAYEFNVLCAYTSTEADITTYIARIKSWRDSLGKKCQLVVHDTADVDHEGVINVTSTVSDTDADTHALVAWVAGAEAGCAVNSSCTNLVYDGEYTVVLGKTQAQLETAIEKGEIVFHLVYGEVRMLKDINSLTTTTTDKSDDFKNNQTIRVIDQIANDIAKLFSTKYLGKIPNNPSGRVSLWGDIVSHHRRLEELQAIENFDSKLLTVEQGENKRSIVVNDVINITNAMEQLYMTVVVQ